MEDKLKELFIDDEGDSDDINNFEDWDIIEELDSTGDLKTCSKPTKQSFRIFRSKKYKVLAIATLAAAITGGTFIAVTVAAPPIVVGVASKILLLKAFKLLVSGLKVAHIVSSSVGA